MALCLKEGIVGVHIGLDAMLAHLLKLQHSHNSFQSHTVNTKLQLCNDAAEKLAMSQTHVLRNNMQMKASI